MLKVGITGGIGTGKTTVCLIFELLGVPIYYADSRAKKLMTSYKTLKQEIKTLLGSEAYYRNGRLNRKYVAAQVFTNKDILEKLNKLVHPAVGEDYLIWLAQFEDKPYTIKEAALLVENGSYKELDYLIVVAADLDIRVKRVIQRDHVTEQHVLDRMRNQLKQEMKMKVADFIIDNSGKKSLISQVLDIHNKLIDLSGATY